MKPYEERWECFLDSAYYDMWAVRLKKDRNFNSSLLFHMNNKEEAESLTEILNDLENNQCLEML